MKYLLTTLTFLISFSVSAQSFPYLNASSGNWAEFPVDKDTNIYMFHGNRLTKTDKNFNIMWANNYSGLNFSNILLSKTGCMFFIAGNHIGRIESNGTLTWCKDLQSVPVAIGASNFSYGATGLYSVFLDHNNELVVTGSATAALTSTTTAFYLKTDTNGLALKLMPFSGDITDQTTITHDSSGYYRFFSVGWIPKFDACNEIAFSVFNDVTNAFVSHRFVSACGSDNYNNGLDVTWKGCRYMKSRFSDNFYIHMAYVSDNGYYPRIDIMKCKRNGTPLWRLEYNNYQNNFGSAFPTGSQFPIESRSGDLLLALVTNTGTNAGAFKLDSNGVINNSGIDLLTSNATYTTYVMPYHHHPHSIQTIYGNKYYEDIDSNSTFSPLIISNFTSTSSDACHSPATCSSTLFTSFVTNTYSNPSVQPVSSFTVNSFTSTVSPTSFSLNFKYCTMHDTLRDVGFTKNRPIVNELKLFPNPTSKELIIETMHYQSLVVTDIFGKIVLEQNYYSPKISVQHLPNGFYFLKLRSETDFYTIRFIKE
jgi:hypothetical protein